MPQDGTLGTGAVSPLEGNGSGDTPQDDQLIDIPEGNDAPEGNVSEGAGDSTPEGENGDDGAEAGQQLYAGMYKTPQELEAAYKKLQTAYQQTKAAAKPLRDELAELQNPKPTQQTVAAQPLQGAIPNLAGVDPQVIARAYQENPIATMQLLNQATMQQTLAPFMAQFSEMKLDREITSVKAAHKDFDNYQAEITQILKDDKALFAHPNRLEIAYSIAKAKAIDNVAAAALKNGVQQGYEMAVNKAGTSAQAVTKGTGTKGAVKKSQEDELADSIVGGAPMRGIF